MRVFVPTTHLQVRVLFKKTMLKCARARARERERERERERGSFEIVNNTCILVYYCIQFIDT